MQLVMCHVVQYWTQIEGSKQDTQPTAQLTVATDQVNLVQSQLLGFSACDCHQSRSVREWMGP